MFVRSVTGGNKEALPVVAIRVDGNGIARKAWQLDEGSAIVVLDKDGRVQWAKRWRINAGRGAAGNCPAAQITQ